MNESTPNYDETNQPLREAERGSEGLTRITETPPTPTIVPALFFEDLPPNARILLAAIPRRNVLYAGPHPLG